MFSCRVAWQTLAPRFSRVLPLLRGPVPSRQMSYGGVPGSSGDNIMYYLLVLGASTVAGFYAYRTVKSDHTRYLERLEDIEKNRSTEEWKSKPWPPSSSNDDEIEATEVTETCEEAKDIIKEETEAVTADESQTEAVIAEEPQVQKKEMPTETTKAPEDNESAVGEKSSSVSEEEQDATDILDEAQTKG